MVFLLEVGDDVLQAVEKGSLSLSFANEFSDCVLRGAGVEMPLVSAAVQGIGVLGTC